MKTKTITIRIPADEEGYVLMKCPQCGELFKLKVQDIHDDGVMNIHCPACFFASYRTTDFITDDVQQHVETLASNLAGEVINGMMKELEQSLKNNKYIRLERKQVIKEEKPTSLFSITDSLKPVYCLHCGRYAKIKPILRDSAYKCPLCGVKNYAR